MGAVKAKILGKRVHKGKEVSEGQDLPWGDAYIQSPDEDKNLETKRNILLGQEKKKMSKEERLWRQRTGQDRWGSEQKEGSGKNGKDVNS